MEERLLHLLETEHLSSSKFADVIGVQRSSVSHILSGRNKPSFDFLQKTLKAFPALNADWLILGEGDMYEGTVSSASSNLFEQLVPGAEIQKTNTGVSGTAEGMKSGANAANPGNISNQGQAGADILHSQESNMSILKKRISRVILLYEDNSFDTYEPGA